MTTLGFWHPARIPPVSLRSRVGMTRRWGCQKDRACVVDNESNSKGKGQSDFSDWPLFMPATTYAPIHLARAVPSALRGLTSVFGMERADPRAAAEFPRKTAGSFRLASLARRNDKTF